MASSTSRDADSGLGRDLDRIRGVEPDHILDLLAHPLRLGRRQVDLVEHRHDLVIVVDRLIDIGQRLRLDPLARIDHQQRSFHRRQRPVDLIGEIDMARRVDQVELIGLAVPRRVVEPHRIGLDGDAALALEIHRIENLIPHLAIRNGAAKLDQPVSQRRLAVVDMRDDREIADLGRFCHAALDGSATPCRQATWHATKREGGKA